MNIINLFSFIKSFLYYILLLKKFKNAEIEKVKAWQLNQLKEQIYFAWEHIPFYRAFWEQHGFSPEQFHSLDDIKLIPIIDKEIVREHLSELLNPYYSMKSLTLVTTGGTTGMPMKFYIDNYKARGKEIAFQVWCSWFYWKVKFGFDKVAIIRGFQINKNLIDKNIFWQRTWRDNGLIFSSFHLNDKTYKIYLQKLRSFRPKYIKAYPSSIVALCILMKQHNDYGISGLKAIICSSENIYESHRALVQEVLGVKIFSFYGHSEKSVAAFQNNNTMYFQPLYGYTEFLNKHGEEAIEKGDFAQIICTSLNNKYFPFIRYNTNDYIEVEDYKQKIAKRILGRAQEFIIDRDGNHILFTCADEIFWDMPEVKAYQYIQNNVGELVLNIEVDKSFTSNHMSQIKQALNDMFLNFDIIVHTVSNIEKTSSGKFRYLIQNLHIIQ